MKILLLGGTGVIGSYLARKYADLGIETYITSRRERDSNGSIHYIKGNAMDQNFLYQVCRLQHWDAIVDFMSYKTDEFRDRLDTLLSSTKQYVFISSARVYGNEEHPIKETSPRLLDYSKDEEFLKTDEYSLTKARQENLLLQSGLTNYTIVRPCITYGPERLQLGVMEKEEWLYRALHGRTIIFCKEIMDAITTMTTGEDICKALYNIVGNPASIGEIYHLTSAHHRTWAEIYDIYKNAIFETTGIQPKIKIVSIDDFLKCRYAYLKYQVIYDRIYNRDYNVEKENSLTDVCSFTQPEVGLHDCIKNFVSRPCYKNVNWVLEARKDKLAGEFTPINEIKGIRNKISYIINRII